MKTVQFQGNTFSVPDWANYITNDACGVFVFEKKPEWNNWAARYWNDEGGKIEAIVIYSTSNEVAKI